MMLRVLIVKEFRRMFSNAFMPALCLVFPFIIMLLMPMVTDMDVKHINVAVVDHDHSDFSRDIQNNIAASTYTTLSASPGSYDVALYLVEHDNIDVILQIPAGFQESLTSAHPESLAISANSVNATKGTFGAQYMQQICFSTLASYIPAAAVSHSAVDIYTLNLFNPTLNYRHFMIPALMIMLLVMLCGFLPALNIVEEKELGTIEQINVSPLERMTFILGKLIPYWIIGFVVLNIAILVAWTIYGLTPAGGLLTIYVATMIFIIVMSSLALIVASFSDNMLQVMLVMFFFVMVFMLMSGMTTPVQSMPAWAEKLTYAFPTRYYVEIMRATYLRGTSITAQLTPFLCLVGFAILFTATAILTYRKRR